ncbi:MAG: response regulator [Parcubacteria group bacterium CG11_big_fil_rev_8_21_14_0_20_39_14]|nr:MAG: response regulator [Parcubacteria group bacterium CG11_big_fil_rev_8_21_14_0_20_39_14]PIS35165.1 MAG: response regulator [Parcubacteria group bacterium CG08_land_8_20_14_0_20_38_56]
MKKILIIEDEKILGEMYRDKFLQAGFEAILVDSAEEGFEMVLKEKPDLVLVDILLPKESGISFIERLRGDLSVSSIPVVAFSNYDDPQTEREALRLGVKEYLIKTGYTPQDIIEKIKNYL